MIEGRPLSKKELAALLGESKSISANSTKSPNPQSEASGLQKSLCDSTNGIRKEENVSETSDEKSLQDKFPNDVHRCARPYQSASNHKSSKDEESALSSDYAGDYEERDARPMRTDGYQKLEIPNPAVLVAFYNKAINEQQVHLYPWQVATGEDFGAVTPTQQNPHKFALCASNGSGKDLFVIAPFAVWFALSKIKSRVIVTSSSGTQLTSQTEAYIRSLAQSVNEHHGEEIFRIRQRYIRCNLSGSEIRLFATDEEGKAEGYHPMEPGAEMAIIINEAKSVAPEIFRALRRCTGYNYWLEVSSPGSPGGDFYKHFTGWAHKKRVTSYDCLHISRSEIEADRLEFGEHSAIFRSMHLALFTSLEGDCVIPIEVVNRCIQLAKEGKIKKLHQEWPDRVGIDLAAGGAENSIVITKGNWIRKKLYFREKDTTITAKRINDFLISCSIPKDCELIFADDGGVGHAIIDMLINEPYGWKIARQNNQSAATDKKRFSNKGAQNWYRAKRLIDECVWFFDPTAEDIDSFTNESNGLYTQLSNRYYKQQETQGKIALESKGEAIANGRPSPDRADGFILSLTGLSVTDFFGENDKMLQGKNKPLRERNGMRTLEEVEDWNEKQTFDIYEGQSVMNGDGVSYSHKANGSVNSILNRKKGNFKQYSNN